MCILLHMRFTTCDDGISQPVTAACVLQISPTLVLALGGILAHSQWHGKHNRMRMYKRPSTALQGTHRTCLRSSSFPRD